MRSYFSFIICAVALNCSTAFAAPAALDGRSFAGTVTESGAEKGDPDTLVFDQGTFRSTACDQYGFNSAPYHSSLQGGVVSFQAETKNKSGNTMRWNGVINGKAVSAHAVWSDSKGATQQMEFTGAESAANATGGAPVASKH